MPSNILRSLRDKPQAVRLFTLSFLVLFLELALIRFTSAEVLYLGYFSNFVLISVFLGIGLGFLLADKPISLFAYLPQILLLYVAFVLVTHIDASYLRDHSGQLFFGFAQTPLRLPLWFSLLFIFLLVVFLFASLGQETARSFRQFAPLKAYSIDIGGSLTGIVVFTLLAWLGLGPERWFLVALLLLLPLYPKKSLSNLVLLGAGIIVLLVAGAPAHITQWSPYQRIEVWPKHTAKYGTWYNLSANGIGHQSMQPVGTKEPIYDFPYTYVKQLRDNKPYDDVLIIGAGSGTDVSYSLHYGVGHVDAVEIDPVILRFGKLLHPARPYQDPKVTAYVNDGRAFLKTTKKKYDLIIFALPDSLASLSNFANIRLESFLFTKQSFKEAKSRLKDDGVLVLYNYYRTEWLMGKLGNMLTEVFGHSPYYAVYTHEARGQLGALAIGPKMAGPPKTWQKTKSATDDWPFLYMQKAELPTMYIGIMALFVLSAVAAVFLSGQGRKGNFTVNASFAFMGASFLLLETKSVIQFSLLFGATWLVNSLVFFAILVSVLIANFLVIKYRIENRRLLFVALFASLAIQYVFSLDTLLQVESLALRYLSATIILFLPIFIANLVFGSIFKDSKKAETAFGWNIIGTMIGGALEYTSLAIGYQALTLIIIALYAGAMLFALKATSGTAASS